MGRNRWAIIGAVACIPTIGCGSSPSPQIRSALAAYAGNGCSAEHVHLRESRAVEGGTLYVADACGSTVEIEQGLSLPRHRNEVTEVSAETPLELPARLKRSVSSGVTEIMRRKIQRWCVLGSPEGQDPELVAFYNATPAQQAECRARLAQSLTPLGTERDLETNSDVYYFALGQYVFTTTESFYLPAAERRSSTSPTLAQRDTNRPIPVRRGTPGEDRPTKKPTSRFQGRFGMGLGHLYNSTPDKPYSGLSWDTRVELGLKLTNRIAFGMATGTHLGLTARALDKRPYLFDLALNGTIYPDLDGPLHFGAQFGVATLTYGYGGWDDGIDFGPMFGGGLGLDFGRKGRAESTDSWSGAGLQLRANFTSIDDHWISGGGVYFGLYYW